MNNPLSAVANLFRPKPHVQVRYVAAVGAEKSLARRKYLDRQLELAVAICHLSPEARAAAKLRATQRLMRAVGRGA